MSDDRDLDLRGPAPTRGKWASIIHAAEHAALLVQNSPRCDVCGKGVTTRGYKRHPSCEPGTLVGKVCTCPPECSDTHYGNGPVACDPACLPCQIMHGQLLRKRRK